jgi:hypothetical protein
MPMSSENKPAAVPIGAALGQLMASMLPQEIKPRCPQCGGRLLLTVPVYVEVPVAATVVAFSPMARVQATTQVRNQLAEIRAQALENWDGDERDELYCERRPACDYWTTVGQLESDLLDKLYQAKQQREKST